MFKRTHYPASILLAAAAVLLALVAVARPAAADETAVPAAAPAAPADVDTCRVLIPGAEPYALKCPLSPDYSLGAADGPAAVRCVSDGGRIVEHTYSDGSRVYLMCSGVSWDDPCPDGFGRTFWAIEDKNGRTVWLSGDPRGRCADRLNVLTTRERCLASQAADGWECLSVRFGRGSVYWVEGVDY